MWWTIAILVLLLVAATAAIILLSGSKTGRAGERDAARAGEFSVPTNNEDRIIPIVLGTRRVSPAVISWWGVSREPIVQVQEIESGGKDGGSETVENVVGFAVFVQVLLGLCEGPIDDVRAFYLDDDLVWSGTAGNNAIIGAQTGHVAAGDQGSGTGASALRVYAGSATSLPEYQASSGDVVPYHRTATLLADGAFVGDNASACPNWSVVVRARDAIFTHNLTTNLDDGTKRRIGEHDVNPADVAWWVLRWLARVPENEIDIATFRAAQATFFEEGTGLSVLIDRVTSGSDILADIERQTDSHIFVSPRTGLWSMRVVREDYDLETLPEIDNSTASDLVITRQGMADVFTDLKISFVDPRTWELLPFRIINSASRPGASGIRSDTIDLQWIRDDATFWRSVARLKRRNFIPIAFARFRIPRDTTHSVTGEPWLPEPGEAIRVTYTDPTGGPLSISGLVFRVVAVEGNADDEASLHVEAAQDVWNLSGIDIVTQPGGEATVPDLTLTEACGTIVVGDSIPELGRVPAVVVLAGPPETQTADRYRVSINGRHRANFPIIPVGRLDGALTSSADPLDRAGSFDLDGVEGNLSGWTQSEGAWQRLGRFVIIEDGTADGIEIVGVRDLADNDDGTFTAEGLIRGLAGTTNRSHPDNARVWVPTDGFFRFRSLVTIGSESTAVSLSVGVTPENVRFVGETTTVSHTYGYRVETPYAVANLTGEVDGADFLLSWSARNRHGGWLATNSAMERAAAYDIAPEAEAFEVTDDDGSEPILVTGGATSTTIIGGAVSSRTYTVRALLRGRFSAAATVAVP